MMNACMGGWCRIRGRCPNYTEADRDTEPSERLCEPGRDGVLADVTAASIRQTLVQRGAQFPAPNGESGAA